MKVQFPLLIASLLMSQISAEEIEAPSVIRNEQSLTGFGTLNPKTSLGIKFPTESNKKSFNGIQPNFYNSKIVIGPEFSSLNNRKFEEEEECLKDLVQNKTQLFLMSKSVKQAMRKLICNQEFSKERYSEFACEVSMECTRLTIDSFEDNGVRGDTFNNILLPFLKSESLDKYYDFEFERSLPVAEKSKALRGYAKKLGVDIPDSKFCEDYSGLVKRKDKIVCDGKELDTKFVKRQTSGCVGPRNGCYPFDKEEFDKIETNDSSLSKTEIFIENRVEKSLNAAELEEKNIEEELFKIINSKDKKLSKDKAIKDFLQTKENDRKLDPALATILEYNGDKLITNFLDSIKRSKGLDKTKFSSLLKKFKTDLIVDAFKDYNCVNRTSVKNICYKFDAITNRKSRDIHISEQDLKKLFHDEDISEEDLNNFKLNIQDSEISKTHLEHLIRGSRCYTYQPHKKPKVVATIETPDGRRLEFTESDTIPMSATRVPQFSLGYPYLGGGSGNISTVESVFPTAYETQDTLSVLTSKPDSSVVIKHSPRNVGDQSSADFIGPPIPSDYRRPDDSAIAALRAPLTSENNSLIVANSGSQTSSEDHVIAANNSVNLPANNGTQTQGDSISGYDQFGHFTGVQAENNGLNGMNPNQLQANGSLSPATPNYIEDLNKKIAELSSKLEDQTKKSKKEKSEEENKSKPDSAVAESVESSELKELQSELKKLKEELVKAKSNTITQSTPSTSSILPNRSVSSTESSGIVSKSKISDDALSDRQTISIASVSDDGIRGNDFKSIGSSVTSSQGISGSSRISGQASTTTGANISGKASGSSSAILTRMDGMNPKTQAEAITRMIQNAGAGEEILIEEGGFIKAIVPIIENGKVALDQDGNPKYEKLIKGKSTDKALISKLAKKDSRAPASVASKTVQSAADLKQEEDKAKLEELARYRKLRCLTDAKYCDK